MIYLIINSKAECSLVYFTLPQTMHDVGDFEFVVGAEVK